MLLGVKNINKESSTCENKKTSILWFFLGQTSFESITKSIKTIWFFIITLKLKTNFLRQYFYHVKNFPLDTYISFNYIKHLIIYHFYIPLTLFIGKDFLPSIPISPQISSLFFKVLKSCYSFHKKKIIKYALIFSFYPNTILKI